MSTPGPPHAGASGSAPPSPPGEEGWRRLIRHSYRLGAAWAAREARSRWPGSRSALQRLLVPLDPWLVRGSHGVEPERPEDGPVLVATDPGGAEAVRSLADLKAHALDRMGLA